MKQILILTSFLLLPFLCTAQDFSMSSDGRIAYESSDIDARVNDPVKDFNDKLCALVKVTVVGELEHELTLDIGTTMQVIERRDRQDIGEVWFYIPAGARRMTFKCSSYSPIEIKDVPAFQPGGVYRITITAEAVGKFIQNATTVSNYVKLYVFPPDAKVSLSDSKKYDDGFEILSDGEFSKKQDYGMYYYKIEHELYETLEDTITVRSGDCSRAVRLKPAFGYLEVSALSPKFQELNAQVYIDGKSVGQTPLNYTNKLKKGEVEVLVQRENYYSVDTIVSIPGDSTRYSLELVLRPNYGVAKCFCEDKEAELWIDNEYKGRGSWTGELPSGSYILEVRKESHESRRVSFRVEDGKEGIVNIESPVPLYGILDLVSEPSRCRVKLDGEDKGTTPIVLENILIGTRTIELSKDGYLPLRDTVVVKHNETLSKEYELERGEVKARVEIQTAVGAQIFAGNDYLGVGTWSGDLPVGKYEMRSVKVGCTDGTCQVTVLENRTNRITIPSPVPKVGELLVTSNVKGASIYLKSSDIDMQHISSGQVTPYRFTLRPGEYIVSLKKDGYETPDSQNVFVLENELTKLKIRMDHSIPADALFTYKDSQYQIHRKSKEKSFLKMDSPFAKHFIDLNMGFDRDGYVLAGASYSWVKARLGAYAAFQMMLGDASYFTVSAGPVVRLTPDVVDLQVYAGLAYIYDEVGADMGLRIGWRSKTGLSLWDFGAGCMVSGSYVIPTVSVGCGISLTVLAVVIATLFA